MNTPPKTDARIPYEQLESGASLIGRAAGMPEQQASLLARLLATNDARGVFSHGTQQMAAYASQFTSGQLNPAPNLRPVRETPTSLQMDGDGGLGYFPAYEGTLRVIEKALENGIGVLSTGNHGHFGAAGIYTRLTLGHDLLAFVTSGHQMSLSPGRPYVTAAGGSPMSFSSPAGEEESLVVDFGAIHDCYEGDVHRKAISLLAPAVVFRGVGLGGICQSWGGFLAGVPYGAPPEDRKWTGANQGALLIAFRIDLFAEPAEFKRHMDAYIRDVKRLEPVERFDECFMPGGLESHRERLWKQEGVPFGEHHRRRLEETARTLDIQLPWERRAE